MSFLLHPVCVYARKTRGRRKMKMEIKCVCVGLCIKKAEWDWLRDNDVWNINPRSSVPIKPPVSRPPSCMQMNQYKGRAWFHRLRPHFFATQTTEELVYCVSHIEMMDKKNRRWGERKNKENVKKHHDRKKTETPGFKLVGCGIYWTDRPVLSVTEQGGEVVVVGRWWVGGAAGLEADETRRVASQTAHLC